MNVTEEPSAYYRITAWDAQVALSIDEGGYIELEDNDGNRLSIRPPEKFWSKLANLIPSIIEFQEEEQEAASDHLDGYSAQQCRHCGTKHHGDDPCEGEYES